jgi:hypothetical protein
VRRAVLEARSLARRPHLGARDGDGYVVGRHRNRSSYFFGFAFFASASATFLFFRASASSFFAAASPASAASYAFPCASR